LKEKYQGEPESDEIGDDDETDDEVNDSTSRITEQLLSIPSGNYPSGSDKAIEPFSTQDSEGR